MRYTCCSNLRQGSLRQASLVGSTNFWLSCRAFLFAIRLTQYLPYSRTHVSISVSFPHGVGFLGHRSTEGIGWHRLIVSTTDEGRSVVPPFRCLFGAPLDWVLSTDSLLGCVEQSDNPAPLDLVRSWECHHFGQAWYP